MLEEILQALADTLGVTSAEAGYLLGALFVLVLVLAIVLLSERGDALLPVLAIGIAVVVLLGWWPVWTVIFVALFAALALVLGGRSSGGVAG